MKIADQKYGLLRFTTVGSVDDGKSTLIGRLMFDTKSIFSDQLDSLQKIRRRNSEEKINLALLTDGLKEERQQGITIDVAYRYFSTPKRKFIIADTPGHFEYTRNMVTGASTANVALILVDVTKGLSDQTKRHIIISALLQIPHLVICINKMDLINYDLEQYEKTKKEVSRFITKLDVNDVQFIPISALEGDNVVNRSSKMPWYDGSTLLYYLETVHIASDANLIDVRFPIQLVLNDQYGNPKLAGQVAGGVLKKGDKLKLLPSGELSKIEKIETFDGELTEAFTSQSVILTLEDKLNFKRGQLLVRKNNSPLIKKELDVMLCWFDEENVLELDKKYILKHHTQTTFATIKTVRYKLDIHTLHRNLDDLSIAVNDIARVVIEADDPICADTYRKNRSTGSLIFIDKENHKTVAGAMII